MSEPDDAAVGAQTPASRLAAYVRGGGVIVPVLTALLAFVLGGLVVLITGNDPIATYQEIFRGTGLQWLFPWPIEDREQLDERRAAVGLGPFADYERHMIDSYGNDDG